MTKTAIILFNLGGPDAPEAVRPFLSNLFNDPAILRLPSPLRPLLAWLIAKRRAPIAKEIYAQIGNKSPILENTEIQAQAIERALADLGTVKCFVSMRYWHPLSEDVAWDVEKFGPDNIVWLPLYPQFSTTTTESSIKDWLGAAQAAGLRQPTRTLCCYPRNEGFIAAAAGSVRAALAGFSPETRPRVLFSAHGLPRKIVAGGDPY
ncbi:MAG: ferrochelatase, partial [Pseudomonadota bacterium]|nr:ferrochelatase [Pseudomonadota bacterium]